MKELTVITVTHDIPAEMFGKMLKSLRDYTPELAQLIVFDNASKIDHEPMVEDIFKDSNIEINYFKNYKNVGWGKACNHALYFAKYEFLATLNDDIEFFSPWAGKMIAMLKNDSLVGQVVPKTGVGSILNKNGDGEVAETDTPDYAEGSCCMTWTSLMKEFGFYDEIYKKGYHEDADLSMRLKMAGYRVANVDMKWIHYGGQTSNKMKEEMRQNMDRNRKIFMSRWEFLLIQPSRQHNG